MKEQLVCGDYSFEVFMSQKSGNSFEEIEDAYFGPIDLDGNIAFAISDGATEGMYSKYWATHLAKTYCTCQSLESLLTTARDRWQIPLESDKQLNWYEQMSRERGSFATLLGVRFSKSNAHALGVGDSSIFIYGPEGQARSWPMESVDQFSNSPNLWSDKDHEEVDAMTEQFRLDKKSIIVMATDAVGQYLLSNSISAEHLKRGQELFSKIEAARSVTIPNDDLTMVIIRQA